MPRTISAAALLLAFAALPPIALAQTGADKSAAEKARAAKDAAIDAQIRSYRCVGADGKKYYGATRPAQCAGLSQWSGPLRLCANSIARRLTNARIWANLHKERFGRWCTN